MVSGPDNQSLIPLPKEWQPLYKDKAMIAEPSVVVEVTYDDVSPYKGATLGFSFVERKFRAIPPPVAINALINAKVTAILDGFSVKRTVDINLRQELLVQIDKKLDSSGSLMAVLPNPSNKLPEFIRRNPRSLESPLS